jgi:hypothetical protein
MRVDPMKQARDDVQALAEQYGIALALDAVGLGGLATAIDALQLLAELIAADANTEPLENEARQFLLEDVMNQLMAT